MSEPDAPPQPEPEPEPQLDVEAEAVENENGLILSVACPNAYVVGVTIVEGQEPGTETIEPAEG